MILDIKRNYKVSGRILKYIKELKSIYVPFQIVFKNIELDCETRKSLDSAKICSVVQNEEQGVEVIEFQKEYRDFLIGKILYLFEEDRKWDYYDEEIQISDENKFFDDLDENKEYAVKGAFLFYIFELARTCEDMVNKSKTVENNNEYRTSYGELIEVCNGDRKIIIEEMNTQKDIIIGKLVSEFEKQEWKEI